MGGATGSRECAPDDKLRDTHHVPTTAMGFAKELNPSYDLPDGQITEFLSSPLCKKILLRRNPKSLLYPPPSRPTEGRLAIVTDAGRDAVDADGAADESTSLRTAKSCGPDAPTLASSWRKATFANDGGKQARSPRRARRKPLKPLRGECRVISGVTVVTNARVYYTPRAAAGASSARHSLRPLNFRGQHAPVKLARMRRDREAVFANNVAV
jgi:hypothetical protein